MKERLQCFIELQLLICCIAVAHFIWSLHLWILGSSNAQKCNFSISFCCGAYDYDITHQIDDEAFNIAALDIMNNQGYKCRHHTINSN